MTFSRGKFIYKNLFYHFLTSWQNLLVHLCQINPLQFLVHDLASNNTVSRIERCLIITRNFVTLHTVGFKKYQHVEKGKRVSDSEERKREEKNEQE